MTAKPAYSSSISIGHDNNGFAAIGEQVIQTGGSARLNETQAGEVKALLADLELLLAKLDQDIQIEVPPEKTAMAQEMAGELKETLMSGKPNLDTLAFVKEWFRRNVPKLAGTVAGIVVNPIVGKLVEVAGDFAADEFRRRFGPEQ